MNKLALKYLVQRKSLCALALSLVMSKALALSLENEAFLNDLLGEDTFDCVILPHAIVDVSSGVSGRLEQIWVERGDTIERDQLLAQLESGVERANRELARARAAISSEISLSKVRFDYDTRKKQRVDTLYDQSAITPQEKDEVDKDAALARLQISQAQERKHLAELELRRAEELLKLRYVKSPIAGVVVERFKWTGEYVEEEPILRIAQLDPLRVEVIVPIEMHNRIDKYLDAQVLPENEPDNSRDATITVIDPMGDPASGTFRVRLKLPNPGNQLISGIKCKARFAKREHNPDVIQHGSLDDAKPAEGIAPIGWLPKTIDFATADPDVSPVESVFAGASVNQEHPIPRVCHALGPIDNRKDVEQMVERLSQTGPIVTVVRETRLSSPNGFIVLLAPGLDEDVGSLAHKLRLHGVDDLLVMKQGVYQGQISVGVYNYHEAASSRVAALTQLGFAAEARERKKSITNWWIDVETVSQRNRTLHELLAATEFEINATECLKLPVPSSEFYATTLK